MAGIKISERESKVLEVLADHYMSEANCLYMSYLAKMSGVERDNVRRVVRSLARKDLAKLVRGLFDDEGKVAGSGYCCTRAGKELSDQLTERKAA